MAVGVLASNLESTKSGPAASSFEELRYRLSSQNCLGWSKAWKLPS